MSNTIADLTPHRIVILRALQIGDLLCAVPAFRALRKALPEARITLVGLPWARSFVQRFCLYLDGFIPLPGFPGFPEKEPEVALFPDFLKRIQSRHDDLAIQMQGSGDIANPLIELFGATTLRRILSPGTVLPRPKALFTLPRTLARSVAPSTIGGVFRGATSGIRAGAPEKTTEQVLSLANNHLQEVYTGAF